MSPDNELAKRGQTVLILGGGIGGIGSAMRLRSLLPKEHRVILVERDTTFVFAPSLLWMLTGNRSREHISRPYANLEKHGIELVRGEIQKIDLERREAVVDGKTLTGDYLVVALGAELAPETIPGLAQAGHNFYSLAGTESARDALASFTGGRIVVLTAAPAYKCPAAPYEATMLIESYMRKRKIRDKCTIDMYAAEPNPLPVAGPRVGTWIRKIYGRKGLGYHTEHQVTEVDPASRTLKFKNGVEAKFDLLIYVPPHRAPRVLRESGLLGENGWLAVDRNTMKTPYERVFALGDVVSIPLALGKPLPKAGVFANLEATAVAKTISHSITGKGKPMMVKGDGSCFIEIGDGRAGFSRGNFYAEPLQKVKIYP
ncbi:MAG: NAD(P)/FAD-dependent oxidoreductase, partial [Myxococcota bacterium]|nr:NAD(P)/FAD-dependent oxidoreductase [Myxococcota bacterium]